MINIKFPDGSIKQFQNGITGIEIAKSISNSLANEVLAISIDGKISDLVEKINKDCSIKLHKWEDDEAKETFWHSSAHIMAEALTFFYPQIKLGIGPRIENGFYYDVDFGGELFNENDFDKIEKKILEIAQNKTEFIKQNISKSEALKFYTEKQDEYKLELIDDLQDGTITFYSQNNFTDLCRGPHLINTSFIKAVKLLSIAGAYWRGDEKRKQMTRVYAITYPKKTMLDEYLIMLEEAKKRDHRKIGKEQELFTFSNQVGQGLPIWLPRGTIIREQLENFLKNLQRKYNYQQVITPHIGNINLYKTSGHYEKYGKDSFQAIKTPENEEFMLKPMNCPHHCEIFKFKPYSYKDLPIRIAEFGTVYRYEQSGELHGLTRVRGFTQDDAHIFCRPDQIKEEFIKVIDIVLHIFKILHFKEYTAQISLRDKDNQEKYIGTDENWNKAEQAIVEAANEKELKTIVEYGEAAFYGPKLDFIVRDAIGRKWQLGTIQVDYNLPERFDLEYTGADDKKHRPVMIHRAPFGSMERFVALLIENTAGKFPIWITPEQAVVIPVGEKYNEYAKNIHTQLQNRNIRVILDDRNEKLGKKIRDNELKKIPYLLIVGEKEQESNSISIRKQGEGDKGQMKINEFAEFIANEINKEIEI